MVCKLHLNILKISASMLFYPTVIRLYFYLKRAYLNLRNKRNCKTLKSLEIMKKENKSQGMVHILPHFNVQRVNVYTSVAMKSLL